jgi:hypothetical protein
MKNIFYQEKTADLQTLQHHITESTATVTKVMFVNIWHKIEYCFNVCRATSGAHTETYEVTKNSSCYWTVRSLPLYNKYFSIHIWIFYTVLEHMVFSSFQHIQSSTSKFTAYIKQALAYDIQFFSMFRNCNFLKFNIKDYL